MKVDIEKTDDSQAIFTIELSQEEAEPFIDAAAKRIAKEVDIKGFRKGKVPRDVLVQHVGENSLYEEAFNDMVEDSYMKAIEKEKDLQIVGRAQIEVEKLAAGNPVVYKATVPLMPTVELGDYKTLKAKKAEAEMDKDKYDRTLMDLRKMRGKEKVVDREAKEGDKVVIDFEVKVDGVVIEGGSAQKQHLVLGEGQMIPGFEDEIVGMKKDAEKDFKLKFPKDYKKELAGKEADFHIKLHDVYEIELPEMNDEFAKELNFESVKKLEEEITANIKREVEQQEQEKFENAVIEELVGKSTFGTLAPQMVDEEIDKMLREMEQEIARQGLKFEDYLSHIKKTKEELREDFREKAEMRIKAALIMREVAVAEDIKVEPKEIEKELEEMKKMYKDIPDAAAQIDSPQHRMQMENAMIHRKTFEMLEKLSK